LHRCPKCVMVANEGCAKETDSTKSRPANAVGFLFGGALCKPCGLQKLSAAQVNLPWQCLYFLPLPHGQGSLRPTLGTAASGTAWRVAASAMPGSSPLRAAS